MRILMMVVATAIGIGVIWPAVSAFGGGGGNEATRLVEATGRAQNKADAVSRSYNDVIPPAIPEAPRRESQPAARQNGQLPAPGSSVGQAQGPSGPGPSQEGKEEETQADPGAEPGRTRGEGRDGPPQKGGGRTGAAPHGVHHGGGPVEEDLGPQVYPGSGGVPPLRGESRTC